MAVNSLTETGQFKLLCRNESFKTEMTKQLTMFVEKKLLPYEIMQQIIFEGLKYPELDGVVDVVITNLEWPCQRVLQEKI
jgi:hypothetical protein